MLYAVCWCVRRNFSTSIYVHGGQLKEKLSQLQKYNLVVRKSKKELARVKQKKELAYKRLSNKAYTKQHALHIVKTKYTKLADGLDLAKIGPTSQDDIRLLNATKDRRLIYTILGITGTQLRDSKLVADDVKKFLRRGQVEKAIYLARIAKAKGASAMNMIMEYYLKELQYPQSAVDLFKWRKKWGVPINEYTVTILFDGLGHQKKHIAQETGKYVLKIVKQLIADQQMNQTRFNAAMSALANCTDTRLMFSLYEMPIYGVKRDSITFTWLLRGCSRIESDDLFIQVLTGFLQKLAAKHVDEILLFEVCKAIAARECKDFNISACAIQAARNYFDLSLVGNLPRLELPDLSHWGIQHKFPPNKHIIGILLKACLKNGQYHEGLTLFQNIKQNRPDLIDLQICHTAMDLIIAQRRIDAGFKVSELFTYIKGREDLRETKTTLLYVYRAFESQSRKKAVNDNEEAVHQLLNSVQQIITENEAVYNTNFGSKVYPKKSWPFLLSILRNCQNDKISDLKLRNLLNEYLKSFCAGQLIVNKDPTDPKLSTDRYIGIEISRLINTLTERLKLETTEILESNNGENYSERQKFLLRRLLLRLKERFLERVRYIEEKRLKEIDEKFEWAIKQLCCQVLDKQSRYSA